MLLCLSFHGVDGLTPRRWPSRIFHDKYNSGIRFTGGSRYCAPLATVSGGSGARGNMIMKNEAPPARKILATALGYAVFLGSCITKLPQIKRSLEQGSVEGVSLSSNYLELSALISKVVYHRLNKYPFSTWAENIALITQQCVIITLIWKMSQPAISLTHIVIVMVAQLGFIAGASSLPMKMWPLLLGLKSGMTILSGGAQIRLNSLNKSTGQVAWSPVLVRVIGNTARIITTLELAEKDGKKDRVLLSLYVISGTLSAILGAQFFLYR
jgi:mannose-P-dolichol utilization defect protein 1